ncbi:sensor histidine kinase [Glaciibacter psychrotolerans]|uniref:histidine kinase n=1 Tax=Glaciibacter psychrotolerans TaxID=670054 RepID=A0A7Z0EG77_9MICO|nr:histidine kinase [Leifsonia psychrotolerans]NYJ21093.1 signal transduction histidine kinase [Leifsonia psychrotolerans]
MPPVLTALRHWLEPAVGALFFAFWVSAEIGRHHVGGELAVLLALSTALALSRVRPRSALLIVAGVLLLQLLGLLPPPESTTWPVYCGVLGVVFVATQNVKSPVQWYALALGIPVAGAVALLMVLHGWTSWIGDTQPLRYALLLIGAVALGLYAGAWAAGIAVRLNVTQLRGSALLRKTATELGMAEVELLIGRERDRIAREVHDVLAHSLAVVLAQADGARFIAESRPEATREALHAISDAARSALVDVRTFIEGLREEPGDEPQPSLADLDPLIARLAGAGMQVGVTHFGPAKPLTPAQELAVFRIVQECLTNALRHAGDQATTQISFDWRGPGLAFTVTSTGTASAPTPPPPTRVGHGIRGMKDRARLAGGWLTAGQAEGPDDDFLVTVFIPAGADLQPEVDSEWVSELRAEAGATAGALNPADDRLSVTA